jgi:hypothetical protein
MGLFGKKEVVEEKTVEIQYSGEHSFHISDMQQSWVDNKLRCTAYIKGEGIVKFNLFGKDYDFKISTFAHVKTFNTLDEAYSACLKMDGSDVMDKIKKEVVTNIHKHLKSEGLDAKKKQFLENNKLTFNFTITATESEILSPDRD